HPAVADVERLAGLRVVEAGDEDLQLHLAGGEHLHDAGRQRSVTGGHASGAEAGRFLDDDAVGHQLVVGTGLQGNGRVRSGLDGDGLASVGQLGERNQLALDAFTDQRLVSDRGYFNVLNRATHHPGKVGGSDVVHANGGSHISHAFAHVAVTATATIVGQRGAVGGEAEVEGVAVADIQQRGLGLVDASVNNALAHKR